MYGDLPLGLNQRKQASPSLQLTFMGPKLYVNQHGYEPIDKPERGYFESVKWSIFSCVYTTPMQYNRSHFDDTTAIVTKAWFEVKIVGMRKILFLRLGFSIVAFAKIHQFEWDGPVTLS
ncbi:hypothetical protein F3Y22_tig00117022pilonHSYRG00014 [Hibiscus syriacus]|uniref:Uncharacterized protein n=1 Tax=Hibiscus syriacus TaxID=106335 RepID=A0A6A2WBK9_HIBSY|nr:hypothetical protein F3Y22_tig00117022pilonHSYRG00014 [Hibiscus syriacus]